MCYQRYIGGSCQILVEKLRCAPTETQEVSGERTCIAEPHPPTFHRGCVTNGALLILLLPKNAGRYGGIHLQA